MLTARDASNVFLADQLTTKERMGALIGCRHWVDDVHIEWVMGWTAFGVIVTGVALVWVLA